jgi:drug/metabolite transporter (DMT)-like permease
MILMLLASACIGIQAFFVKLASPHLDASEVAFLRFAASYAIVRAAMGLGWVEVQVVNRSLVITRGVLGGIGNLLYFYAIEATRLSNAIVLLYTYPIFAGLFARWGQHAPLSRPVILALGGSFLGIYLIVSPSFDTVLAGDIAGLFSGLAVAGAIVSLKASRKTDSAWTIFHYFNIAGMALSLPLVIARWATPSLQALPALAGVVVFSMLGQLGMTYAYRYTTTAEGGALSMFGAVVGSALGIGLLGEPATAHFLIGASIVVSSGIYLTVRGSEDR